MGSGGRDDVKQIEYSLMMLRQVASEVQRGQRRDVEVDSAKDRASSVLLQHGEFIEFARM